MGFNPDTITVIISILVPTLSGFVWIIHRMDKQFEKVDKQFEKVDQRFEKVDQRFEKVEVRFEKIESRISSMENKLTAIDMRTSFIERLLEMVRIPQLSLPQKEITDP